jgi:hypothetical protein
MHRYMLSLLIAAAGLSTVVAQAPVNGGGPWFGLTLPSGLGDPHRPVVDLANAAPPPPRVPSGEEGSRHQDLNGARIRTDLETIVGFSRQSRAAGDRVWGRVTGFPALAATMGWTAEQFRAAGLSGVEVQQYEANAPMWWSRSWEVRLLGDPRFGAGTEDVVLGSALPTSGSQLAGGVLTAPLAFVESESTGAGGSRDLNGHVAVQYLRPAAGAYSERGATVERARALFARGAVAVLNIVDQVGNMHVRDFGNCGGACFNLGTADGRFLRDVLARAGQDRARDRPRARIALQSEMLSGLKGQNTVGIVAGRSGAAGEHIIVNAHADGWFDAAGDNGDGLAVLVAMARHFSRPENRLERTLVFVASGGHHSTGLNGPANFVRMNPELASKTVLVINLEHVAQLRVLPDRWRADSTEQPMNFGISNQAPFLVALGKRGAERYGFNLNAAFSANVPGDLGGYAPLGVPRVQAIHSGPMYHTSGDVVDTISAPGVERAARFFAFFVTEASKAPRSDLDPARK